MKAHVVVADMDPSRIDVARRAVTHDLIPHFRAQAGAVSGYWLVNRATGEVLVLTMWDDDATVDVGRSTSIAPGTNLADRTGLGIRVVCTMDVLGRGDAPR
jgi:hypothetical protein